jgi:hypothetical protein
MEHQPHLAKRLLHLVAGRPLAVDGPSDHGRALLVIGFVTAGLAALWGLAAGSASLGLAATNLFKLPMIVLLPSLAAIPAGLLMLHLFGIPLRFRHFTEAVLGGTLAAALVLAVFSPLVGLYYNTSTWAGPYLAVGSAVLAFGLGARSFLCLIRAHAKEHLGASLMTSVVVTAVFALATMTQLIAMLSPILPEATGFESGIDWWVVG